MGKENTAESRLSSLNLFMLNYYDYTSPVSEVMVGIGNDSSRRGGVSLDRQGDHPTRRDEYCLDNEIARMFENVRRMTDEFSFEGVADAATARKAVENYLSGQLCSIDEKALDEKLDKFVKNDMEAEQEEYAGSVWRNTLRRISMNYGKPGAYDVDGMRVMGEYFADVVKAQIKGEDVNAVPMPDSRLSLLKKISGKSYNYEVEYFAQVVERLSPRHLEKMSSMLEMGIPGKETCEGISDQYWKKGREIRGKYSRKDREDMRSDALKFLTKQATADALKGKYFDETGDLSVFMDDKEKANFEKMSFAEMAETYGMALVKTHKGATMVGKKLAKAKEKGGEALGEALDKLTVMIHDSRHESNHPDISLEVRQRLLDNIEKSYQKFGPADDKFRAAFNELIPNPCELGAMNTELRNSENTPLHKKLFARNVLLKKINARATELATGKSDITAAKKRLKSRQKEMKQEMLDNTGFAAVAALATQAEKGYAVTPKAVEHEKTEVKKGRQASLDKMIERKKEKSK